MRRKEKTFIAHVLSFMIMGPVTGSEKSLLTLRIRSSAIGDRVVDRSDRYLHAFMFQGEIKKICSRPLIVVVKIRCVYLAARTGRSEEHTSELQSRGHLVCRLLLEKKNTYA